MSEKGRLRAPGPRPWTDRYRGSARNWVSLHRRRQPNVPCTYPSKAKSTWSISPRRRQSSGHLTCSPGHCVVSHHQAASAVSNRACTSRSPGTSRPSGVVSYSAGNRYRRRSPSHRIRRPARRRSGTDCRVFSPRHLAISSDVRSSPSWCGACMRALQYACGKPRSIRYITHPLAPGTRAAPHSPAPTRGTIMTKGRRPPDAVLEPPSPACAVSRRTDRQCFSQASGGRRARRVRRRARLGP